MVCAEEGSGRRMLNVDRQEEKRSPEKTIMDIVEEDKHRVGMVVSRKGSSRTKTTVTSYGYTSD